MNFATKFAVIAATLVALVATVIAMPASSAAAGDTLVDGSISWMMVASILVFMMVPGAAFFYGGMLRKQSMTSIMAQSLVCTGILGLIWFICGYSLAFANDGFIIADFSQIFFNGVSPDADGTAISSMEFAIFQMMFAVLTATLMVGAFAERVRFPTICWFLVFWGLFVYVPMAHWVWGGGFFDQVFQVADFAGGLVVHICAGISGVAVCVFVGTRKDSVRKSRAHNITLAYIGAMMLWLGWLGFNGGSGCMADGQAIRAIMVTCVAAMTAMMVWAVIQYLMVGRITVLGLITGAVAGMVAITPAAGYVEMWTGLVFGALVAVLCYFSVRYFHNHAKLDDALDVFAVHGCGGILGSLLTGVFSSTALGCAYDGIMYGNFNLFIGQAAAAVITLAYCFAVSYAIIFILGKVMKVRVPEEEEVVGPDMAEHGEPAYVL